MVSAVSFCNAQDELPCVLPDRPGFTYSADVMHRNKLSFDNGFAFEAMPDGAKTFTLSSAIFRYGLFDNMEVRVGTDFLLENDGVAPDYTFGVAPLTVGMKIKLLEGHGIVPSIGFLAELKSPHIGSKAMLPSYLTPAMYAIFEHAIGERFWLCYNAGLEWDGETAAPQTFLALGFGASITKSLGAIVETYNYLHREEESQHFTEFGLTWLISRHVQLDIEADLDFRHLGTHYGIGCGVAWLIN